MNIIEEPTLVRSNEGTSVNLAGVDMQFPVMSHHTDSTVAVAEWTIPPGLLGAPPHKHDNEDEIFYVLSGEVTVLQGDEITVAGEGSYVILRRGVFHTFWNAGDVPTRLQVILSPGFLEGYFQEVSRLIRPDAPPDMEAIGRIADDYGLHFDFAALPQLLAEHDLWTPVTPPR